MRLLNSTNYLGKEWTIQDVRGFIPNKDKGIPEGFYGGRVTQLAKTDVQGLYLCMEKMEVIDLIFFDEEMKIKETKLENKTNKELVALLEEKGIEVPSKYTKAELLALLEV